LDGRRDRKIGSLPSATRSAKIIHLRPLLLIHELPADDPALDPAPVAGRRWRWKRKKSTLSWPEKIMAVQIGFALESLVAALEKFVS